jgi:hypothetical protein
MGAKCHQKKKWAYLLWAWTTMLITQLPISIRTSYSYTKYNMYVTQIKLLETSFEYDSNGVIFVAYL